MKKGLIVVLMVGFIFIAAGCLTWAPLIEGETQAAVPDKEAITAMFDELKDVYFDERLSNFMSYFSEDEYPAYDTLEEDMEYTFDNNSDLNLNIVVTNVTITGNSAIAKVDWDKAWDDSSTDSGSNNTVRLKKIEGAWKVVDLEDDTMFTIGTGTVSSYATD